MSYSKPEWGYEGPAQVSRTMGLILATVIGVIAGAGAVVFLIDQPVAGSSRSTSIITQPVKAALRPDRCRRRNRGRRLPPSRT